MPDVTATKRKVILREVISHQGSVPYSMIERIASRHQLSHIAVRNLLTQAAYVCEDAPQRTPAPRPEPAVRVEKPRMPLTPEEHALIKSGRLYRLIDSDSDYVIVRRHLFEKERAIIVKLLAMFAEPHEKA